MHLPKSLSVVALLLLGACSGGGQESAPPPEPSTAVAEPSISGRIQDGLRVLTFDRERPGEHFTIYRGDYVRPELATGESFTIEIADLGVSLSLPADEGERSYFKVPEVGTWAVRIGEWTGEIEAIEYAAARYREVDAQQAALLLTERDPFLLDVRTPREFAAGHLEGAVLIPVQELSPRLAELEAARDRPVFIYCRSGNRSTVAAKLLVDAGFDEVINLRRGIVDWERQGLPVVK
jgi:rhodanese-related sulfurtransferase